MRMRKKKWVRPFLDNEKEYLSEKIETDLPIYLEIGMGMGDFICESALINKDIFYVGLEKDETCVARAIIKAKELGLENFKVMHINADEILEHIKEKVSTVFIYIFLILGLKRDIIKEDLLIIVF